MKNHPTYHVSQLERVAEDPLPGQVIAPPPPVIVDDEEEYLVEEVLDSRVRRKRLQYLIKWLGHTQADWMYAEEVNKLEAVDRFHEQYPEKPGPLPEDDD